MTILKIITSSELSINEGGGRKKHALKKDNCESLKGISKDSRQEHLIINSTDGQTVTLYLKFELYTV